MIRRCTAIAAALVLAACHQGGETTAANAPGDMSDTRPWSGIGEGELVQFTGTEPFWGGQVSGSSLKYSTPEMPDGTAISVERFAGRNGISYTGTYEGGEFALMVTPGECSDGMSDRTYPFTATLQIPGETRYGCAWTSAQPYSGPQAP